MKKLQACLSAGVLGLLLVEAASAQGPFSQSDTEKADALLKQMTVAEKIGQLNQPFYIKVPVPGVKSDSVGFV